MSSPSACASPTASRRRASPSRMLSAALMSGRSTMARFRSLGGVVSGGVGFIYRFVDLVQLDGRARHNGRDRVLVDQLDLTVPAQQNAEIVEPGNDALQLHAVDEEDCERGFRLSDSVEEGVLEVLFLIHGSPMP